MLKITTRETKAYGVRWIARDADDDRTIAKGWMRDGECWATFGELTMKVRAALIGAGVIQAPPALPADVD